MDIRDARDTLKNIEHLSAHWTYSSFKEAIANIENWMDVALEGTLRKSKYKKTKENITRRFEEGKYTPKKIQQYARALEDSRDSRYLIPYCLVQYLACKTRANAFHSQGLTAQAYSNIIAMSFYAGILSETAEANRGSLPDYTEDPVRKIIASTAANATHTGAKQVQLKVEELILSEKPTDGWTSKKAAATAIEPLLIEYYYIEKVSKNNKAEFELKPKLDLNFKLNLRASALHDRILKWMGTGKEGVQKIREAIESTLRPKTKKS